MLWMFADCAFADIGWMCLKVSLTFQILSVKDHKCKRFLPNEEPHARRAGYHFFFFLACFLAPHINLIFPTHGSWGTFYNIKQVILVLICIYGALDIKCMKCDSHFTKRSRRQLRFSNLLTLIKPVPGRTSAQYHFLLRTVLFPPQFKAPQSVYDNRSEHLWDYNFLFPEI